MGGEKANRGDEAGSDRGTRSLICAAMLDTVGELGYGAMSVEDVLDRGAFSRNTFYRYFDSKRDCFLAAYREETEALGAAMLEGCESGLDWTAGLISALRTLLGFVAEHPARARAILVESHGGDEAVTEAQVRVVERLADALDRARRQPESHHSAPPLTAALMIGAVESLLLGLLAAGEGAAAPGLLGDLTYLIVMTYFNEEAAFAAMDAATAP